MRLLQISLLVIVWIAFQGCTSMRSSATTRTSQGNEVISPEIQRDAEVRAVEDRTEEGKKKHWLMDTLVRTAGAGINSL